MKNVYPIIFITAFLLLFLFGDLLLIYFLIKINKISVIGVIVLSCLALLLGYIAYSLNFGILVSTKQLGILKDQLSYSDQGFILYHSLLEYNEIVPWESVEAIFLSNRIPLEGEYHNFEYLIFLNTAPTINKSSHQSWFNRILPLPKVKKGMIQIDDHRNIDFYKFKEAISKHLVKNNKLEYYLGLKFGNETHKSSTDKSSTEASLVTLKSFGFYKIFDRGSNLGNEMLTRCRQDSSL